MQVAWRGVDHDAGGLVDGEEVVVLVQDAQRDGFGLEAPGLRRGAAPLDAVTAADDRLAASLWRFPAQANRTGVDVPLNARAGLFWEQTRQRHIEALSVELSGHFERDRSRAGVVGWGHHMFDCTFPLLRRRMSMIARW